MNEHSGIYAKQRLQADFTLAQLSSAESKAIRERRRKHKLSFSQTTTQSVRERNLAKEERHKQDALWKAQKNSLAAKLDYRPPVPSNARYRDHIKNEYRASRRKWEAGHERLEKFHQHVREDLRQRGRTLSGEFRKQSNPHLARDYSRRR